VGLTVNGTHQLHAYVGDVILLGNNVDAVNDSMENLIDASWSRNKRGEINLEK
jgi:hypothetical protein